MARKIPRRAHIHIEYTQKTISNAYDASGTPDTPVSMLTTSREAMIRIFFSY